MKHRSRLIKRSDVLWEIPPSGGMRVPGRILASESMIDSIERDKSFQQVMNVAHLPGIVGYSWAMPDVHAGYGFPIGGVAATAFDRGGVVSPGGVGYDINCGCRMFGSKLTRSDIAGKIDTILRTLFERIPSGPTPHQSGWGDMNPAELRTVLRDGAAYVVERGMGESDDLTYSEEEGCMEETDPDAVSDLAVQRGRRQLGSLGSGNHFLEIDCVDKIFTPEIASVLGIDAGDITFMIHTGSRGLGHQVCTDYLKLMSAKWDSFGFQLPDRQLAAAPLSSRIGRDYIGAMAAAANFAWANRQVLMSMAQQAVADALGTSRDRLGFRLLYDITHNIAKIEDHTIDGQRMKLCVHRKGATRALPPGDARLPVRYLSIGQPVLVPGDMGTASYLCVGAPATGEHPFFSSCHGAGRMMSRKAAQRNARGRSIPNELRERGVSVLAKDKRTLAEEMPEAYKNVAEVVDVLDRAKILITVARMKPIGVIKG
jgi:tRNA-splicing ligase RtcB